VGLYSFKKETSQKVGSENLQKAIEKIHTLIKWTTVDTKLSLKRLEEKPNSTYFLLSNDHHIEGYVTIKPIPKHFYISFIAISPDFQGKKGGKALMRRIFQKAIKHERAVTLEFN
jgi:ribosomal protein S18 acetylase RimI-like enzyme